MRKDIIFFILMAASSVFGLLKTLLLASILDPSDFSFYLTLIGISFYITYFISFGAVEKTYGHFPELVAQQDFYTLRKSIKKCVTSIAVRTIFLTLLLVFLNIFIQEIDQTYLYAVPLYSLTAVFFSLIASLFRANSKYVYLSCMNLIRSVLLVGIITTSKIEFTFIQIINIELSIFIFASITFLVYEFITIPKNIGIRTKSQIAISKNDGLLIACSTIFLGIPLYLDRLYIKQYYSTADLTTYSLLVVIWGVSILIFNTIAQRTGAPLVVMTRDNKVSKIKIIKYVLSWWLLGFLSWLVFLLVFHFIYNSGLIPQWNMYEILNQHFILIAILGMISVNSFLEFILIGLRKERVLLQAAVVYILVLAMTLIYLHLSFSVKLYHFLIAMIISRFIYNFNLTVVAMRSR